MAFNSHYSKQWAAFWNGVQQRAIKAGRPAMPPGPSNLAALTVIEGRLMEKPRYAELKKPLAETPYGLNPRYATAEERAHRAELRAKLSAEAQRKLERQRRAAKVKVPDSDE